MYTSFLQDLETAATSSFATVSGGVGTFVHLRMSDLDDAFNRPKPIIGLFSTAGIPDISNGVITYNVGILFAFNDNVDNPMSQTTAALNSAESLYLAFLGKLQSMGYSLQNLNAEREVRILNNILTGWALTFTTIAQLPC